MHRHPVDHVQRRTVAPSRFIQPQGIVPAYRHVRSPATGRTRLDIHPNTRHTPLQQGFQTGSGNLFYIIRLDRCYGSDQLPFLSRPVGDHRHLIQVGNFLFHLHDHLLAGSHRHLLRTKTDKREYQIPHRLIDRQRERPVRGTCRPDRRAIQTHGDTHHRFPFRVHDLTFKYMLFGRHVGNLRSYNHHHPVRPVRERQILQHEIQYLQHLLVFHLQRDLFPLHVVIIEHEFIHVRLFQLLQHGG